MPRAKLSETGKKLNNGRSFASHCALGVSHQVFSLRHASLRRSSHLLSVPGKYSSLPRSPPWGQTHLLPPHTHTHTHTIPPVRIPRQPARWAQLRVAITARPPGSDGERLADVVRRDWLHLSLLMDGFLDLQTTGCGSSSVCASESISALKGSYNYFFFFRHSVWL